MDEDARLQALLETLTPEDAARIRDNMEQGAYEGLEPRLEESSGIAPSLLAFAGATLVTAGATTPLEDFSTPELRSVLENPPALKEPTGQYQENDPCKNHFANLQIDEFAENQFDTLNCTAEEQQGQGAPHSPSEEAVPAHTPNR